MTAAVDTILPEHRRVLEHLDLAGQFGHRPIWGVRVTYRERGRLVLEIHRSPWQRCEITNVIDDHPVTLRYTGAGGNRELITRNVKLEQLRATFQRETGLR